MKSNLHFATALAFALIASTLAPAALSQQADPGWPRLFQQNGKQLTVYQPQVDYWNGYTNTHFRCAIALKGVLKQERFGVAEIDAVTVVDQLERIVVMVPTQRELRFPNASESELALLHAAVDELRPPGTPTTISLDRVLACLNPAAHATQPPVEVNLNPPRIFYSRQPSILVILMGEAQFKPVETNRTDLMFALNTNWDLFYDTVTQRYFLLNGDNWLAAPDVKGPWTPAQSLPPGLSQLPANGNWADVLQNLPGKRTKAVPLVFVSTEPAELIVTDGEPSYSPITGTQLMRVTDSQSTLFLHTGEAKFYFLVAGRWFRAVSLDGPWSPASTDLPSDFARIPNNDPAAFVKASVPGTREAQDAVLLASIPTTTTVDVTNAAVTVTYDGAPQFVTITNTVVQYAVNTPRQVFLVSGKYYCCDGGVWFAGSTASGPWTFCSSVPAAIYTIPASSPCHNVTYVVVQSSTPTTVVYSQTAGYSGEYVAATGVLMFGAGMMVGAAIANSSHYYYPPYPCFYSYGCAATYHYGYGGYYYAGGARYGPYGGAGYATAYNPATGTYSRSASAYGPYGSAHAQAAYNPYTGAYAHSAQVSTAYGSAGRAYGYNPTTGTSAAAGYRSSPYGTAAGGAAYNSRTGASAAGGSVSTASGSAGRAAGYNPTTGQGATAATRSGEYGSAGNMKTTSGGSATTWNTANGQGAVGKTSSGDVYAAKDGTAYKKDAGGGWSQNSGSGWQSVSKPPTQSTSASSYQQQAQSKAGSYQQQHPSSSTSSWNQNRESMESQAQSRSWGNHQHESSQSWRSSGGFRGGGGGRR